MLWRHTAINCEGSFWRRVVLVRRFGDPHRDWRARSESRSGAPALGTVPAGCFAAHSKPSPLRVGQSKSLASELLLQDTVLFSKKIDDCVLLARDPFGHRGHEDSPGIEHRCHPAIVARSSTDRQLST